ncbi:MAG: hypothetical protein PHV02_11695 [Rhodocyclaceae bacterium]|nr:hypothetical protein [Rhodocyclaceae bacterium]
MTETLYCYCCRVHHPSEQMRRFETRHGARWRCLRSIQAARSSVEERDQFGRGQSDINLALARLQKESIIIPISERRLQRY